MKPTGIGMHQSHDATPLSGRQRVFALWFFLTVATAGFALLAAGVLRSDTFWTELGTTVLGFGTLSFVFVQFWTHAPAGLTAYRPSPAAHASGRAIDFNYDASKPPPEAPAQPNATPRLRASAAAMRGEEPLVEFQLVGDHQAPTRLHVPSAFHLEQSVNAAPPEPAPWRPREAYARERFTSAVERRQAIVSGLPLLTSILGDDPPEAVEIRPNGTPAGKMRGPCSSCHTFLWAPTQRPIRLRCPKCGHVRTITD